MAAALIRAIPRLGLNALRGLRSRLAVREERIGAARLRYAPLYPIHVRAWYLYIVELLRQALADDPRALRVALGRMAAPVWAGRPIRRIDLQCEHTLVKPGGRDSEGALPGTTPLPDGSGRYLARVAGYAHLRRQDAVIEYSQCNIEHLRAGGRHAELLAKAYYIAPLLYVPDLRQGNRSRAMLTLMADEQQPRRARFLAAARAARLPLENARGIYAAEALAALFDDTRILINLRQTDSHDTFEELRVLPALLRGVVVISEDVPLRERIPYHEHVIWCRYDELVERARAVHADYAGHHRRLFGDGRLLKRLAEMAAQNRANARRLIADLGEA